MARPGAVRPGWALQGTARAVNSLQRLGNRALWGAKAPCGTARRGRAWQGASRRGEARADNSVIGGVPSIAVR